MDILQIIKQPISDENPVGAALEDSEELEFIDQEMMKVGSLSHGSIQWAKVQESALQLLQNSSKDIKVLANLLQCMLQTMSVDGVLQSLKVLSVFVEHYWLDAHPVPGDKGKGLRARFYKQMMQRNCKAAKRIDVGPADLEAIAKVLAQLETVLSNAQLDLTQLVSLKLAFKEREVQQLDVSDGQSVDSELDARSLEAPPVPKVYFDPKNERATRQSLFSMAHFLNTTDASADLGYRVRRNALWFSIWQLPSSKQDFKTELAAFSKDRYSDYVTALEKLPTLALLNKIERSIEQSPYWFDGQYLSYQLCEKLGYQQVAAAIHQDLQRFVERLPEIVNHKAVDGSPFASEQTLAWLNQQTTSVQVHTAVSDVDNNWRAQYQKIQQMSEDRGLAEALNYINGQLADTSCTRENYYWRLLSADLLHQQQLTCLAKNEYLVLLNSIQGMSIDDWEPSFAGHIKKTLENMDNSGL